VDRRIDVDRERVRDHQWDCVEGSVCVVGNLVPDCMAESCCAVLRSAAHRCATRRSRGSEELTCEPWYEPGTFPPGLEALGVCIIAD